MKKILISFVGTGKKADKSEAEQYEETVYQFPNGFEKKTSLITSALIEYLNPNKIIIIGTSRSIWAELSHINPKKLENNKVYEKIWEETWSGNVSKSTLSEWENVLKVNLNRDYSLNIVSTEAQEEIVEILYKEFPDNAQEVFLDVTHAFRHFPLIAAFTLPVLKYVKNFNNLILIYGKLSKSQYSPVYFLDIPSELLKLLEAISLTENCGNFEKFSEIFNDNLFSELYLKTETNQPISQKNVSKLENKIRNTKNIYQTIASEIINKDVIPSLTGDKLEIRMAKRAVFFAERKQFLKAYTLIYEALTTGLIRKYNLGDPENIKDRENLKVNNYLSKEDSRIYHTIRQIRNFIAHGQHPKGRYSSEIINALNNEEKLRYWILQGKKLLDKLSTT